MSPSLRAKPYVGMHCDMVLLLQVTWSTMNVQRYDLVTSSRRPNPDLLHAMLVMLSATGAGACEAATRKALPGSAAAARDVAACLLPLATNAELSQAPTQDSTQPARTTSLQHQLHQPQRSSLAPRRGLRPAAAAWRRLWMCTNARAHSH